MRIDFQADPAYIAAEQRAARLAALADLEIVPQAEAEAGTATAERIWTAQRVAQAIAALGGEAGAVAWGDVTDKPAAITGTTASFTTALETKLSGIESGAQVNVATDLSYTAATRVLASSTGADVTLPLMSSGDAGLVPASGGGTTNFLRADGTFAAPPAGAGGDPAPTLYKLLTANATGANSNTAQPWFPSAGAVTVEGATLYEFEGTLLLTSGTASHNVGVSFGGTATITDFSWVGWGHKAAINASTTTQTSMGVNATMGTNRVLTAANTTAGTTLYVRGWVRINAGGTFIPRFQYSAAPGSSSVLAGTWFGMWKWGASSATTKGTWA